MPQRDHVICAYVLVEEHVYMQVYMYMYIYLPNKFISTCSSIRYLSKLITIFYLQSLKTFPNSVHVAPFSPLPPTIPSHHTLPSQTWPAFFRNDTRRMAPSPVVGTPPPTLGSSPSGPSQKGPPVSSEHPPVSERSPPPPPPPPPPPLQLVML